MISAIVTAAKAIAGFAVTFLIDYISEIFVTTIINPSKIIIETIKQPMSSLVKPLI